MTTLGNQEHVLKYKVAVAGLRKANDPLRLAHAVRHLGDAYRHAGQTSEAEACYVEALSIYRSRDDRNTLDLANAIRGYAVLKNKRVGLVTNQTGVDSRGVRAQVLLRKNCNLVALYAPEHGLDGTLKAGRYVRSHRDPVTGLTVHSLYGPTRKPTRRCCAASIHSSSIFRTSGAAVTPTSAR